MELNKILDRAIMLHETSENPLLKAGYRAGNRIYPHYLDNASWKTFVDRMEQDNPTAYEMYARGGGKELEERNAGRGIYPPKMASFGSSSRMIYNLMKHTPGFLFEKKLPTMVGGTANLDGFMEKADTCIFVEAKCREPYTDKSGDINIKYRELYEAITASGSSNLSCAVNTVIGSKMQVEFSAGGTVIKYFDMKQMICHLLGVAAAYLNGDFENKKIEFIYLLYDPTAIKIENTAAETAIHNIYHRTCLECGSTDFKALFYDILSYLQRAKSLGADKDINHISNLFTFRLCDQNTITV